MSDQIDYITAFYEIVDNQTSDQTYIGSLIFNHKGQQFAQSVARLSQFKHSKQLYLKFTMISLHIRYKTNQMILYPSLSEVQIKEVATLKWVIPSSIINDFQKYLKNVAYYTPINDSHMYCVLSKWWFISICTSEFI